MEDKTTEDTVLMEEVNFEILEGRTISNIIERAGRRELWFECDTGEIYLLYHEQDCCERVTLDEVIGDLDDIVCVPILLAELVEGDQGKRWDDAGYYGDHGSYTWTFYKLSTIKGSVTLRWLGESNGYYSERVSFVRLGGTKK